MTTPVTSAQSSRVQEYQLTALTNIWTGDASGKPDRTITTGLLGSIRWWFEVLVRGLGGKACDPTSDVRCPDKDVKEPDNPGHHCVVCELFGCTGWARKFRFDVLAEDGQPKKDQITKDEKFKLRFTELRKIAPEEWALLDLTLRLIAKYGAIGAKTKILKSNKGIKAQPSNGMGRVHVESDPTEAAGAEWQKVSGHLQHERWRRPNHRGFEWAAADKLPALPEQHRRPEALLSHLRSDSRGGA